MPIYVTLGTQEGEILLMRDFPCPLASQWAISRGALSATAAMVQGTRVVMDERLSLRVAISLRGTSPVTGETPTVGMMPAFPFGETLRGTLLVREVLARLSR